jgi:sugar fermentation stimulation protein A
MADILIPFPPASRHARFIRREKRFLVEVRCGGERLWVHCNNSGSMLGLLHPETSVWLSPAAGANRRLPFTLELIENRGQWVGVNTLVPNRLLRLAWRQGLLPETLGYEEFRGEARTGGSRLDAFLSGSAGTLWVEAKNVTLVEDEVACFPDAVTERGQKHLRELMHLARSGARAAIFYLVQRSDGDCFGPADFIDPEYADLFWEALDAGVEAWPYRASLSPAGIGLGPRLPVHRRR